MKLKNILLLFLAAALIVIAACKDKGTEPPVIKNPRDYNWTMDTLSLPGSAQTMMRSVWGSSPNDVFAVGHNDQGHGKIWHFDGNKWTEVRPSVNGAIDLFSIYGFSQNNIWAVGERIYDDPIKNVITDSSLIIHYDGTKWSEVEINRGGPLIDIKGSSPNDIWASGVDKTVYHYDGVNWTKDTVITQLFSKSFPFNSVASINGITYLIGLSMSKNYFEEDYFLSYKNNSWTVIDSLEVSSQPKWGSAFLWVSPQNILYSCGDGGIFKWNGNSWINVYPLSNIISKIMGTSEQSIFAVQSGHVFHYNGSDMYEFKQVANDNVIYIGLWVFQSDVFIVGYTLGGFPNNTIVLHGR
ncbi:MAG: hypothetical protein M1480_13115 [Bacteroidetes bacterium]|nr:hypothetical protein [Bacteroidota bacterium]